MDDDDEKKNRIEGFQFLRETESSFLSLNSFHFPVSQILVKSILQIVSFSLPFMHSSYPNHFILMVSYFLPALIVVIFFFSFVLFPHLDYDSLFNDEMRWRQTASVSPLFCSFLEGMTSTQHTFPLMLERFDPFENHQLLAPHCMSDATSSLSPDAPDAYNNGPRMDGVSEHLSLARWYVGQVVISSYKRGEGHNISQ